MLLASDHHGCLLQDLLQHLCVLLDCRVYRGRGQMDTLFQTWPYTCWTEANDNFCHTFIYTRTTAWSMAWPAHNKSTLLAPAVNPSSIPAGLLLTWSVLMPVVILSQPHAELCFSLLDCMRFLLPSPQVSQDPSELGHCYPSFQPLPQSLSRLPICWEACCISPSRLLLKIPNNVGMSLKAEVPHSSPCSSWILCWSLSSIRWPGQPATSMHLTELTARANSQLPSRNGGEGGNLLRVSLPSLDADSSRGLYEQH